MGKIITMELHELLDLVNDEQSFLKFVAELKKDREREVKSQTKTPIDLFGRGPHGWENHTIEDFLSAAKSWAEDSNFGESQDLKGASPWKKFAVFLYYGKIYE
jgi:hypothetical protein